MLRYWRLDTLRHGSGPIDSDTRKTCKGLFVRARTTGVALAAGFALSACSADIMRFDSPALGLGGSEAAKAPPPLHSDGSLFDQRPGVGAAPLSSAPAPYAGTASQPPAVERRQLADAAPQADTDQYRPERSARAPWNSPYSQDSSPAAGTSTQARVDPPRNIAPPRDANIERNGGIESGKVVVQRGDTLYMLARRNGVTVSAIKQANGLTSNVIRPGQVLQLGGGAAPASPPREPEATYSRREVRQPAVAAAVSGDASYTVQSGDSLYAIARRTGVRVAELKRLNDIEDVRRMRPGIVLRLRDEAAPGQYAAPQSEAGSSPTGREYAAAENTDERTSSRMRPLSGNQPIILNPKSRQRISEPATRRPRTNGTNVAARQPVNPPVQSGDAAAAKPNFRWPVTGRIVRGFGKRSDGSNNDGINIAVPVGTDIHASESGTVAYAGDELKGYGNLILVRHAGGYVTAYAHNQKVLVRRGDDVRRGQVIAKAGKTGSVSQPQLHFELRDGAKPIDPIPFLGRM